MNIGRFEEEWESLKKDCEHSSFIYDNPAKSSTKIVNQHFRDVERQEKYGVYVIRQRDTGQVLYIGKGGTVGKQGNFKEQDIPGRLTNRRGNISSAQWFGDLARKMGALAVEYVFLTAHQSPAFVEALLLQAYLNEHGCLPYCNKTL
jgi:hypothetical protein